MSQRLRAPAVIAVLVAIAVSLMAQPARSDVVTVSTGSFFFEDATEGDGKVVVAVGTQLTFVVVDNGQGSPHTVEIDELGIHSGNLGKGETYTTPPLSTPGTYRLYCKPHRRRGHETTLVVQGPVAPTTTSTSAATTTTADPTTTAAPGPPETTTTTVGVTTTNAPGSSTTMARDATTTTQPGEPDTARSSQQQIETASTGAGTSTTTLATIGRGTAEAEVVAALQQPGALEEALGRPPARDGPWTRSIWSAVVAGLVAGLVALVAGRRAAMRAANASAIRETT